MRQYTSPRNVTPELATNGACYLIQMQATDVFLSVVHDWHIHLDDLQVDMQKVFDSVPCLPLLDKAITSFEAVK